jgi:PKHD-type hydroxylase
MWGLTEDIFQDNVNEYAYADKLFDDDEIKQIIALAAKLKSEPAKIRDQDESQPEIRYGDVKWIEASDEAAFIYKRLVDFVLYANKEWFNFDIVGFLEPLQFTIYEGEGRKFLPHIDKTYKSVTRKLSLVVQLSDPEDYEGGDLQIINCGKPHVFPKKKGHCAIFPSYVLHEVTPIVKGNRYTLVAWVGGPSFK